MRHNVFCARILAVRWRVCALALPVALAGGAAPATAQTISMPPCAVDLHGPTLNDPRPEIPVHGEGWPAARFDRLIRLEWPQGVIADDGTRSNDFTDTLLTGSSAWDGAADLPMAFYGPGGELPPGAWPFTMRASLSDPSAPVAAETSITIVQPGVTVNGLPRVKKRRIVGRSQLTLWGVDPALNGRKLYGHILRNEASGEVKRFPAGVASADPCAPVSVPGKVKLLSRKAGAVQTVRFTDTKRFKRARDIPHLSFEMKVNLKNGRTKAEPTFDATRRGVTIPANVVAPR